MTTASVNASLNHAIGAAVGLDRAAGPIRDDDVAGRSLHGIAQDQCADDDDRIGERNRAVSGIRLCRPITRIGIRTDGIVARLRAEEQARGLVNAP